MIDPNLPLIELHRHLDGSVRLNTILDLGRRFSIPLPAWDIDGLRPYVQITSPTEGVMAFIAKFKWMVGVLGDYDACERIAYENVEDAYREGIDYIELRFSPTFMAEPHQLNLEGVVEAVVAGIQRGIQDFDIQVNLIGIISRTYGVAAGWKELNALLSRRDDLVGLDLAGDEVNYPASWFDEHFTRGRDAGWRITVHAGESSGPESIWQAIRNLGAVRIGHGVSALQDPKLVETLLEQKIGIETSLTSNFQTGTIPDLSRHPIKQFLEIGLLASLNTDDPGISGIDLKHEYRIAASLVGLTPDRITQAQKNALEIAFLSQSDKAALLTKKKPIICDD
jgi:adenosine deaminase